MPPGWVTPMSALAAVTCLVAGFAAWPFTGHGWWAIVGSAAATALVSAGVYYRFARSHWPSLDDGIADIWDQLYVRAPALLVAVGVAVPAVAGAMVWTGTGDWRWVVTGLMIGTMLPPVGAAVVVLFGSDTLSTGQLAFSGFLLLVGLPGALLGWMWTTDVSVLLYAGGITVAGVLLTAFSATSNVLRGD